VNMLSQQLLEHLVNTCIPISALLITFLAMLGVGIQQKNVTTFALVSLSYFAIIGIILSLIRKNGASLLTLDSPAIQLVIIVVVNSLFIMLLSLLTESDNIFVLLYTKVLSRTGLRAATSILLKISNSLMVNPTFSLIPLAVVIGYITADLTIKSYKGVR
jgi:hypothetical protein